MQRRSVLFGAAATALSTGAAAATADAARAGYRVVASGLRFPEGPVAMPDGTVLVMEIAAGRLSRVAADGAVSVVAELGGGPNGAAIGPGGHCFVCNNGGLGFGRIVSEAPLGSIQKVDLSTGSFSTVYRSVAGRPLIRPNDLVFDRSGGFWFTDAGRVHARSQDFGGVYWARADGSEIREVIFPSATCNGIALSPDGRTLYVAGAPGARQIAAYSITEPGVLEQETAWVEYGRQRTGRRPLRRLVASVGGDLGFDSMKAEAGGNLVVGTTEKGGLSVFRPDGSLVEYVPLPDPMTTNMSFGGADMKTCFVCLSSRGELVALRWPRPGLRAAYP